MNYIKRLYKRCRMNPPLQRSHVVYEEIKLNFLHDIIMEYDSYFEGVLIKQLSTDVIEWINNINIFPNGNILTVSLDGRLKVWNLKKVIYYTTGHARHIKCSLVISNSELCIPTSDGLEIVNIINNNVQFLYGKNDMINHLTLCGKRIVSSSYNYNIEIWDDYVTLGSHNNHITSLITIDQKRVASRCLDGLIKIWDVSLQECVAALIGTNNHVTTPCMFFHSGNLICNTKTLEIWNVNTHECTHLDIESINTVSCMIVHEAKIILALKNGKIEIHSPNTYITIKAHRQYIKQLLMLKDGRLASCARDENIKIWDIITGKCNMTLRDTTGLSGILPNGNIITLLRIWG